MTFLGHNLSINMQQIAKYFAFHRFIEIGHIGSLILIRNLWWVARVTFGVNLRLKLNWNGWKGKFCTKFPAQK